MKQCKDIQDLPILQFLRMLAGKQIRSCYNSGGGLVCWEPQMAVLHKGFAHSITNAIDYSDGGHAPNLVRAKMASLIRRGLVDGCACGCRGDFELTEKGLALLDVGEGGA